MDCATLTVRGRARPSARRSPCPRTANGTRRLRFAAAIGAVLACGAAAAADAPFNLHEVAPGVFVHQGVHVAMQDPRHDDIANIGFIVGGRCVAVIDTGGSLRVGAALRDAIRAHTDRPVCFVINTHVHFDHLLGNAAFRADRPEYLGHADLADAVEASRELFLRQFGPDLGDHPGPDSIVGPDVGVSKPTELDLGGRVIEVAPHPPAHSYTDVTVLDRQTGTLWTGDLVFIDRLPALDGSLRGWIAVLEELQKARVQRVVPGHGPPSADWPGSGERILAYLRGLRDEVRGAIARGVTLEDAMDTVGQARRGDWLLFAEQQRRNVSKAYTELEWE